jgi:hypothetical protein
MQLVRPGGDVSIGKRSEFPKSLQPQAKAYDELVLRGVAGVIEAKARSEGAEAAGAWASSSSSVSRRSSPTCATPRISRTARSRPR